MENNNPSEEELTELQEKLTDIEVNANPTTWEMTALILGIVGKVLIMVSMVILLYVLFSTVGYVMLYSVQLI